ncbi:sulfite exporter TauE/SafE family protein [Celeribacter litoreus]|uniref:sulfite exporter TauE/SafE family protein n=1 Tax=Celeribacter litoreus TaxID=2876714 RepID=UPI001CC9402A|nr:sulfite exporter TauE/SafE family protein [Celeribacter litoreus]MCA0043505.1 sulfite exporter TauE/SafE family protein [Celeribacter litoreus]
MTLDPTFLIVLTISVTILGLSKGGFAGIGMVSTPLVAAFSDPLTAVALMLPIMLVQDVVAVYLYRYDFDKALLAKMIPGGVIGVLAAYLLASSVPEWVIKAALGAVSLLFSVWQVILMSRGVPEIPARPRHDTALGVAAGAAGGFASAIAHAGSPPFQIYVMPKHLRKEIYVGTSVMFFASLNLMKLPSFAALGFYSRDILQLSLFYVPLAVASSWAGSRLVRTVDPRAFNFIITLILFFVSFVLLWQAYIDAVA